MASAELSQCDVLVIARDAAGLFAAYDCARIGLLTEVWVDTTQSGGGFLAHIFSNRDSVVASACDELGLSYVVHREAASAKQGDENIAGIPANPFSEIVREKIGWRGAWRLYSDRIRPVLKIGNETSLDRLVSRRLGDRALNKLVNPQLRELYGVTADKLTVDAVAPGLAQAMTRAGSLTGGVLELIVQDARNAERLTIPGQPVGGIAGHTPAPPASLPAGEKINEAAGEAAGEATMVNALIDKLRYLSSPVREIQAATLDVELREGVIAVKVKGRRKKLVPRLVMGFQGLDVPAELTSEEVQRVAVVGKTTQHPGLESAIPASRQASLHLRADLFSGQQNPPIGSAPN